MSSLALSPSPNKLKTDFKKSFKLWTKKIKNGNCYGRKWFHKKFLSPERQESKKDLYKRSNTNKTTRAATLECMDNVAINLPGKKSVNNKTKTQKKILPKRPKYHNLFLEKITG